MVEICEDPDSGTLSGSMPMFSWLLCIRILQNNTELQLREFCINVNALYDRKEEQEENPTAVIYALKAYDKNIRSFKAAKYIGNSSNSSTSSINDESGISSDESQRTTQSSETTDAMPEHSQVCNQPSTSTLCSDSATVGNVSIIHYFLYFYVVLNLYIYIYNSVYLW